MTSLFRRRAWTRSVNDLAGPQLAAHWLMLSHHFLVICTGLLGILVDPSPSIERVVGASVATGLWSGLFVACGLLAWFARFIRAVIAELWFVGGVVVARFVWAAVIIYVIIADRPPSPPAQSVAVNLGSLQTAAIILSGAVFMAAWMAWAVSWIRTGTVAPATTAQIHAVARKIIDQYGDHDRKDR